MKEISCMNAAESAWRKMVLILFKPFDFAKWITLGFCAWIAYLGEIRGHFNFSSFGDNHSKHKEKINAFINALNQIFNGDSGNIFTRTAEQCHISVNLLTGICAGIAVVFFIIIVISLVLAWLKSRFKFILLDNLIHDRAEIAGPWRKFKICGNSAFLWRLVLCLISMAIFMLLLIPAFSMLPWLKSMLAAKAWLKPDDTVIDCMVIDGLFVLAFGLFFALVKFFFEQFVVPVMYWSNLKAIEAWKKFLALAKVNLSTFIRYILLYIVFSLMAVGAIIIAVLATCCIGFILLAIPLVGTFVVTVLLLPVFVFFRLFGVELLAQFGSEYNIHLPPPLPQTQAIPTQTEPPALNAS